MIRAHQSFVDRIEDLQKGFKQSFGIKISQVKATEIIATNLDGKRILIKQLGKRKWRMEKE